VKDLAEGSDFRKQCAKEAPRKRELIEEYMVQHQKIVVNKWKKLVHWMDTKEYIGGDWEHGTLN